MTKLFKSPAIALATAATFTLPSIAFADTVRLKSYDGSATIEGELHTYKDGAYDIATPLGQLRIPAILVACEGTSCPAPSDILGDLITAGDVVPGQSALHLDEHGNLVNCPATLAELALSGAS